MEREEGTIIEKDLEEEMKESYLRYSLSVIISRALPDVRDGLKPSQRRILYAMRQLKLFANSKQRKCAKICGDTSGDYHPHGETVIYPTLVRMAQSWNMRYCLIEGQGNFGSIDGDPPAQMRYTEARLTRAAEKMMDDLEKETVDFIPNYDETRQEPVVFPSLFPNLLCNGSSGIAVGMATNIPPHNLGEVCKATSLLLDNPQASIEDIMAILPGPDFPTGGEICGYEGIRKAFKTGRGKIYLRGKYHIEEEESDYPRIVITEIPYNVNKAALIQHIADLINRKEITSIRDLRDESDKEGMRIAIELKKNELPSVTINQLYKLTDLYTTFGANVLALDKGMPRTMSIKHMIVSWIEHRMEVIRRRTRFDLNRAQQRLHIVEGYLRAIDSLTEVINIIKASANKEEAKRELIARFDFTERQANAILELRLYQLTGLEREKLQAEAEQLKQAIARFRDILANESLVKEIIKSELNEVLAKNPSPRRTTIVPAENEMSMEDLISNERVAITLSDDDYIKRMPIDTFREQRRGGVGVIGFQNQRETDLIKDLYVASTHDTLLIFTNLGRCYWLKVWQLPDAGRRSKGRPLIQFLEDIQSEEKIATIVKVQCFDDEALSLFFTTRKGTVKRTALQAFSNPRRKGIYAITIDEGDELMKVCLTTPFHEMMLFTRQGMAVRFEAEKVREMGRTARGVRGVSLAEDDVVINCEATQEDETILVACENGYGKRSFVRDFRKTNRGGKGVRSIITSERNGSVVGAVAIRDCDQLLLISSAGQTIRISMEQLRVMGRSTQGVRLVQLREQDRLLTIQKIESLELHETHKSE